MTTRPAEQTVDRARSMTARGIERVDDVLRGRRGTVLSVAVLVLVTWSVRLVRVSGTLDGSWTAALTLAKARGLVFGRDIIFTYGPLGFMNQPYVGDPGLGLVALLAGIASFVLLVTAVVVLLRRSFSPTVAVLLAAPLLILTEYGLDTVTLRLFVVVVLWGLTRLSTPGATCSLGEVIVIGVVAGLAAVVKADAAAIAVVGGYVTAASAYATGGLRAAMSRVGVFVLAVGGGLVGGWLAAGQPLGALGDWVRATLQIADGYDDAMGLEGIGVTDWARYVWAAAAAGVCLWLTARCDSVSWRRRIALLGLLAIAFFVKFKAGFVLHDIHVTGLFALAAVVPLALLSLWGRWRGVVVAGVAGVALVGIALDVGHVRAVDVVDPARRAKQLVDVTRLVVSPEYRDDYIENERQRVRRGYALPPPIVEQLDGRTAHIEPFQTSVAFAYPELNWLPAPVFQSYAAYTPFLDNINADFFASADRPELVIRHPSQALHDRLTRFESPRATLELLCHSRELYSELYVRRYWQLLETVPDRCGEPRRLGRRSVRFGETVSVPASDDAIVAATFDGLAGDAFDRLRGIAYKPRELYFDTGGVDFRFVPGTQSHPHVLSVPPCSPLPGPHTLDSQIDEFRMQDGLAVPRVEGDTYQVEFLEIPYSC